MISSWTFVHIGVCVYASMHCMTKGAWITMCKSCELQKRECVCAQVWPPSRLPLIRKKGLEMCCDT